MTGQQGAQSLPLPPWSAGSEHRSWCLPAQPPPSFLLPACHSLPLPPAAAAAAAVAAAGCEGVQAGWLVPAGQNHQVNNCGPLLQGKGEVVVKGAG